MTKKKRAVLIVIPALVLALAAFCLWYTRPVSIAQLAPELDREQPFQFHAYTVIWHKNDAYESFELKLQEGDPLYEEVHAMLDKVRIKRTIPGLIMDLIGAPSGGVAMEEGMVNWVMDLDGSTFQLQYWGGQFLYSSHHTGNFVDCAVVNGEETAAELNAFFLEYSTPKK